MPRAGDEAGGDPKVAKSVVAIGGLGGVVLVALVALIILLCCAPCLWYRSLSPDLPFN